MDNARNEVTRQLCASAVLMGRPFREIILERTQDKYRAVAPEAGLDAQLLAQVCVCLDEELERHKKVDLKYMPVFLAAWIVALILAVLASLPAVGVILFVVGVTLVQLLKGQRDPKPSDEDWLPYFSRHDFDPLEVRKVFSAELSDEIRAGLPQDDQNVVVYEGFTPFVGAGLNLGGWSFAINLNNPKTDALGEVLTPEPFEISELYAQIEQAHESLAFEGLTLKDMLFVNGRDIRDDRLLLPRIDGRPVQHVDPQTLEQFAAASDDRIRHYKWISTHYAGKSLVVSFFLRCSVQGNNLYCEINRFLLTPLLEAYQEIDAHTREDEGRRVWRFIARLLRPVFYGLGSAVVAWVLLLDLLASPLSRFLERRRKRKEEEELRAAIEKDPLHNYGASDSIRERCSRLQYTRFFQLSDKEMYIKVIDRTILDTIVDFIDAHNIDTSDLKERRTTIMNSGVIVQGGNVEAEVLAVGTGAQATATQGAGAPTERPAGERRES